jgi:hypothetical protein
MSDAYLGIPAKPSCVVSRSLAVRFLSRPQLLTRL